MNNSSLYSSLLLLAALGLSACGGGGGDDDSDTSAGTETATEIPPATTDADDVCLNYSGVQTLAEITAKGFTADGQGTCRLARNHEALAEMGVDTVRMASWSGAGAAVAVIDSGFRVSHEAIRGQVQSVAAYHDDNANYQLDSGEKTVDDAAITVAAHGTAIAALLAGQEVGVAPGAGLWLKATGDENPYTRDLAIATLDALVYENLDIINHSTDLFGDGLIYRSAGDDETGILPTLLTGQAVIAAAAGNTGLDLSDALDTAQARVADLQSFLDFPEQAAHVLLVGVYDAAARDIALFSNHPGHRQAVQARFLAAAGTTLETASSGADTAYRNVSGTSFAVPLVAGALAVVMEADPRLTPMAAADILLATARRPAELGYGLTCTSDTERGTFTSDCGAMKFGRGILDLAAAVARL